MKTTLKLSRPMSAYRKVCFVENQDQFNGIAHESARFWVRFDRRQRIYWYGIPVEAGRLVVSTSRMQRVNARA